MRIISESEFNAEKIVQELKQGSVLVYPTETSYGLGCDATNQTAVDKIFTIKERDIHKTMLVVVADLEDIKPYIIWDERLTAINKKYWPGPLTVVVPAQTNTALADKIVSADGYLAFRVTSNPVARALAHALQVPLVSTSANLAGEPALFSGVNIITTFSNRTSKPDLVMSVGDLPVVPASTIIKLQPTGFEVLRAGAIIPQL